MKFKYFFIVLLFISSCGETEEERYLFFLHNRFLETHELFEEHPQYGRVEYKEIIQNFESAGLKVISEKRPAAFDFYEYARKVAEQIDSFILKGIPPENITIVGTSKGGYIAQYVSTYLENPEVNFVFVAAFRDSDIEEFPEINFCGNILTIFEKTDEYGVAAKARKATSTCQINHFKEVEINTGLKHGFLFKRMPEWMKPTIEWAKGNYDF